MQTIQICASKLKEARTPIFNAAIQALFRIIISHKIKIIPIVGNKIPEVFSTLRKTYFVRDSRNVGTSSDIIDREQDIINKLWITISKNRQ